MRVVHVRVRACVRVCARARVCVRARTQAVIFLCSGMELQTDSLVNAVKEWRGLIFGVVSILALTPIVSFGILAIPTPAGRFVFNGKAGPLVVVVSSPSSSS